MVPVCTGKALLLCTHYLLFVVDYSVMSFPFIMAYILTVVVEENTKLCECFAVILRLYTIFDLIFKK